jgi:glutathione peroxidase
MTQDSSNAVYRVPVRTLDGKETTLEDYRGRVLLVVNVASACGLTPQYAGLQSLYERERERGFEVLGFPCNQFGAQEPGTNDEIATFCETSYGVTFPMFDKIEVNGPHRHPLYAALVDAQPEASPQAKAGTSDIAWNFEKFLIDRNGGVVARFSPQVPPDDASLVARVEEALEAPAP